MTLDEARTSIAAIAAREVLDERAVIGCADCENCKTLSYESVVTSGFNAIAAGWTVLANHAGYARPCAKHAPSRLYAWVADISPQAFADHFNATPDAGAYEIETLRVLLPKARAAEPDRGGFRFL